MPYDRKTICLHWLTAALVVALWGIAQVIDLFPPGSPRIAARSAHILLGAALGVVLILRIAWRLNGGTRLAPSSSGWRGTIATALHLALYILVMATVALGIANAWIRGDTIIGLFTIPPLDPGNTLLKKTVENLHGTAANLILAAAGLHAAAALYHHYVLKDDVLRRMLPERQTGSVEVDPSAAREGSGDLQARR